MSNKLRLVFDTGVEYIFTNSQDNSLIDGIEKAMENSASVTTQEGTKIVININNLCFVEKEGYRSVH